MNVLVAIFGDVHRPHKHYCNIANNSLHQIYSFFPTFLAIFASITILGNAHRPCKHYPNIVNNSIYHVYSFFLNFSNFLAILELITIFRNAHRPCNQCPNIIINSEHHPYFFPILLLFFVWKYKTYHIWWFLASISVMHSGSFQGLFRCKYQNINISKFWQMNSTGMVLESTGMTGIRQESVGHR